MRRFKQRCKPDPGPMVHLLALQRGVKTLRSYVQHDRFGVGL